MSILPSVETSQTPTLARTAVHFARDVASQSVSPGRGTIARAAIGRPRRSRALLLRPVMPAVSRVGRKSLPRWWPANAPIATGVYGGRSVVVPDLGNGALGQLGHDREAVDVGGLALVGRHAERGVALEMLDRAEAFARGERDVVAVTSFWKSTNALPSAPRRARAARPRRRSSPARAASGSAAVLKPDACGRLGAGCARRRASAAASENEPPAAPATRHAARHFAGNEGASGSDQRGGRRDACVSAMCGFQPPETASRSTASCDDSSAVARARGCARVACDRRARRRPAPHEARGRSEPSAPRRAVRRRLRCARRRSRRPRRPPPARSTAVFQPSSPVVKTAARRARRDAEAIEIGAHGRGQHHAGPIVAAEHDRPLDRAGGEHRAFGDDPPQPLARLMRRRDRQMIGDALQRAEMDAGRVIDAEHRRARA